MAATRTTRFVAAAVWISLATVAQGQGGPCTAGNILLDGGFEAASGSPPNSPNWVETSELRGSPLCTIASCGSWSEIESPRTGAVWMLIGGGPFWETTDSATVSQTVVFPGAEATAVRLRFFLRTAVVYHTGDGDSLKVRVDGVVRAVFPEPAASEAAYSERTVDLLAFADGGPHTITLEGESFYATFSIDDIRLVVACPEVSGSAMSVDSPGTGVLRPNVPTATYPTWSNTTAAPVNLTTSLSNFGGPAGPTYNIVDGAGAYGTLASGATAACADCFQLQIVSGGRPLPHWDATVLETPSPAGSAKSWSLHVGDSFTDVPSASPFYRFVETLLHHGITAGCGAGLYCPTATTTREQMAAFVVTAKEGLGWTPPPCTTPPFGDVPVASPFCRYIDELRRRGVVAGCGGGTNYCPGSPVQRDQMAVFVLRTLEPTFTPPPCNSGSPLFADMGGINPFCPWVEELARRGVVSGCGGGNYCPLDPVTREQMGVFLTVTFGLSLYGP
jgi:hypothetical protein